MKRWVFVAIAIWALVGGPVLGGTAHRGGGGIGGNVAGAGSTDPQTSVGGTWNLDQLDHASGVASGDGASANPYPIDWSADLQIDSVIRDRNAQQINYIYEPWIFNNNFANTDLLQSGESWEFSYQAVGTDSWLGYQEHYWQIAQSTIHMTFSAGGSGSITMGYNYNFTNGAICRPLTTDSNLADGADLRFTCEHHTPPAVGNTITGCTGTACTGGTPTATVATVIDDQLATPLRPYFWTYYPHTMQVDYDIRRSSKCLNAACSGSNNQLLYWLSAQSNDNVLHLGHGGYTTPAAQQARVSIPFASDTNGNGSVVGPGDIAVDTSNSTTYNAGKALQVTTHKLGPQLVYIGDDGSQTSFIQEVLGSVETQCITINNTDATTGDNTEVPLAWWQPVTIVAVGCRNLVRAPATNAVLTIKDRAGNGIGLDSTLTCAANNASITFVTTDTNDSDSQLTSGEGLLIDVTTASSTTTDAHDVCFAFKKTKL